MNLKYTALTTFLREKVDDPVKFVGAVSIALGVVVGSRLPLPGNAPAALEAPMQVFNTQVRAAMEAKLCAFNEGIVVDLDLAFTVGRAVWLMRLGLCYPPATYPAMAEERESIEFLSTLSGQETMLPEELYGYLRSNTVMLMDMGNRIWATICDPEGQPAPVMPMTDATGLPLSAGTPGSAI